MRAMFDALLAAAAPTESAADLYAIVVDGAAPSAAALQRAITLFSPANVLDARSRAEGAPADVVSVPQPADRGTLPAVASALLELLLRDPDALVLVTGTRVRPADALEAVAQVVEDPVRIATFRTAGDGESFADGLAVVAEARVLLRLIFEAYPAWSDALCATALEPARRAAAYEGLAAEAIEPLLHAAQVARHTATPRIAVRPTEGMGLA